LRGGRTGDLFPPKLQDAVYVHALGFSEDVAALFDLGFSVFRYFFATVSTRQFNIAACNDDASACDPSSADAFHLPSWLRSNGLSEKHQNAIPTPRYLPTKCSSSTAPLFLSNGFLLP